MCAKHCQLVQLIVFCSNNNNNNNIQDSTVLCLYGSVVNSESVIVINGHGVYELLTLLLVT